MRFSIRDLLWLVLVVAMGLGWWRADARRLEAVGQAQRFRASLEAAKLSSDEHAQNGTSSLTDILMDWSVLDEPAVDGSGSPTTRGDKTVVPPADQRDGKDDAAEKAIDLVERLKGSFELKTEVPDVRVHLQRTRVKDSDIPTIAGVADIIAIDLSETDISDVGVAHLARFKDLKTVSLQGTRISGEGFKALTASKIETLDLTDTFVDDQALLDVVRMPAIEGLVLNGTRVTDRGLRALASSKSLKSLSLDSTAVTGTGFRELSRGVPDFAYLWLNNSPLSRDAIPLIAQFRKLRHLELAGTHVDDAALKSLSGLTELEALNLKNTLVTDKGLQHVVCLLELEVLDLRDTNVTEVGIRELIKHPKLQTIRLEGADVKDVRKTTQWLHTVLPALQEK